VIATDWEGEGSGVEKVLINRYNGADMENMFWCPTAQQGEYN
jgi:hypothetical protein